MRVPEKIKSGENFKSAFLRWSNQIVDYLRSAQIVGDHKTVSISQTASGTVIHARTQQRKTSGSSGSAPAGMFAVSYNSDSGKIEVKWDHGSETGIAGHIYVNLKHYTIYDADDIEPEEGYLCIKIDTNGQNQGYEISPSWPDFPEVIYRTEPNAGGTTLVSVTEDEKILYPIAEIKAGNSEDEGWEIYQLPIYQPPQLLSFGVCDDDEDEEETVE